MIVSEVSDEANDNLKQGVGLHWTRRNITVSAAHCVYQTWGFPVVNILLKVSLAFMAHLITQGQVKMMLSQSRVSCKHMDYLSAQTWKWFTLTLSPPPSVRTNLLWPGLLCLSPFFLLYTQKHTHTQADRGSTPTSISPFYSLNKQGHFNYLSFLSITGNLPPSLPSCPPGKSAASGPHRVQPEGQERPAEGRKGEQRRFCHAFSIWTQ